MSPFRTRRFNISPFQERILAFWVIVLLVGLGFAIGGDFGESIDEPNHATFGRETLAVYRGQLPAEDTTVDPLEHGPFYSFVALYGGRWVRTFRPNWIAPDGRHFIYYLSFVMATVCIGALSRRYTRPAISWLVAGLFFTQPLLLGHAFINPKDVPFMAFFLGALTFGVYALPGPKPGAGDLRESRTGQCAPSTSIRHRRKSILVVGTVLACLVVLVLWSWNGLPILLHSLLETAYNHQAPWPLQNLFDKVASDAYKTPLDLYAAKLTTAFVLVRRGVTLVLTLGVLGGWGALAWRPIRQAIAPIQKYLLLVGAGIMLGLATSIRAVAPYAAVPLVILFLMYSPKRRVALINLLILTFVSLAACLATWPFLWKDTLSRYLQSVITLSEFPWDGIILFNGQIYSHGQQPWYFIPVLMLLQLTLPVMALAGLGTLGAWRNLKSTRARVEFALLLATFLLPILASLRPGTTVYNNFRQFLFTVPAFFLLAGVGLDRLFTWIRDVRWQAVVAVLALVPGVAGIINLHPYEYMYYNALAGIGGPTYTRFESDYWCTSYREAMNWVNEHADLGATVAIGGSGVIGQTYEFARSDLHLVRLGSTAPGEAPSLAVVCDGKGGQRFMLAGVRTLMTVTRAGATMAEVKDLNTRP